MQCEVSFATDNDAFADDQQGEPARILRLVATLIEAGQREGKVTDRNGHTVGSWHCFVYTGEEVV